SSPESAHARSRVDRQTNYQRFERCHRSYAKFIAATNRERETVSFNSVCTVSLQYNVSSRVIWISVHGIRPIQRFGSRKTNVSDGDVRYCYCHTRFAIVTSSCLILPGLQLWAIRSVMFRQSFQRFPNPLIQASMI